MLPGCCWESGLVSVSCGAGRVSWGTHPAGPRLHQQRQQQDPAHSLSLSAGDEEGSFKATASVWEIIEEVQGASHLPSLTSLPGQVSEKFGWGKGEEGGPSKLKDRQP